jgi:hypothetical protein
MTDELKPAASLTAVKVKRTWEPSPAQPPSVPAAKEARAEETAPYMSELTVAALAEEAAEDDISPSAASGSFIDWRRASLFGIVYVCALLVFATAFDIWSVVLER